MVEWIGFYGCSIDGRVPARMVRIGWKGKGRAPRPATVPACPACGRRHKVPDPCWRRPRDVDHGRDVDLQVVGSKAG